MITQWYLAAWIFLETQYVPFVADIDVDAPRDPQVFKYDGEIATLLDARL